MRPSATSMIKNLPKSCVLQHASFWLFAFIVLAGFFAREYGATWLPINLIYTMLFLWSIALVCYLNLLVFIPRFLRTQKWLWYAGSLILAIGFIVGLHFFTFGCLSDRLFPEFYFITFYEVRDIINFGVVFLAATTLLKLAKGWFAYQDQQRKLQVLQREKLDAELQALKAQINPHFLFNSLNSLYALSLDQDQRVSKLLLKLSANMRYLLYETNDQFVLLEKEIEYLKNYLELQRLRSDQRVKINFEIKGKLIQQRVIPLVFLPFVENAFKHGIKGDTESVYVQMQLEIDERYISFDIVNNKGQAIEIGKQVGGVGLENVKKRLELVYKKEYTLFLDERSDEYRAQLKIPIR